MDDMYLGFLNYFLYFLFFQSGIILVASKLIISSEQTKYFLKGKKSNND